MADKINEIKINPVANGKPEIGIDTDKTLVNSIIDAAQVGALDISSIDALSQSAQTREQAYELIDSMSQDDVISAVLETYAEDTVQTNDKGEIIWVESNDSNVLEYITWLMDSLNIDKHLYQWTYCLITYGDVYIRLYRKSDVEEDKLFKKNKHNEKLNEVLDRKNIDKTIDKTKLTEDAKLRIYSDSDKYIPYVQMVDNPGEMFDLQKFGKTHGYIKAPTRVVQQSSDELYNYLTRYKMKQSDVEIFDATSFVHGCLESTNQRQPETVDIYLDGYKSNGDYAVKDSLDEYNHEASDSMTSSYTVKRGQSILYNSFRIWRELNLLEMSALLNRLTKSSVIRVLNVDVGDMPKEQVQNFMQRLKDKIEQKTAIQTNIGMSEYTNPSPIENTIYVPTHGGQGTITPTTIGGDFDPKSLVDIEYFRDKLFGSLKVPKQYYGFTEDGAGFNGGTSLTILSSRYGKSIKNIQKILCETVIDLINLFLIDRGLDNYVNKFKIRMQEPVTQEELDRRANNDTRIRYVGDLMQQLSDIDDKITKLKIYKALLGPAIADPEVTGLLQDYIDELEAQANAEKAAKEAKNKGGASAPSPIAGLEPSSEESESGVVPGEEEMEEPEEEPELPSMADIEAGEAFKQNTGEPINEDSIDEDSNDSYIPSPDELGFDAVNNKEVEK